MDLVIFFKQDLVSYQWHAAQTICLISYCSLKWSYRDQEESYGGEEDKISQYHKQPLQQTPRHYIPFFNSCGTKITVTEEYFKTFILHKLILLDAMFRKSDESEKHLFMDTSTTYGGDLCVESLVKSLVEWLYSSNTIVSIPKLRHLWHIFQQSSSRFQSFSNLPTITGHFHQP